MASGFSPQGKTKGVNDMEVLTLLETIEEMLEKSANIPLTKKAVIDRDEIIGYMKLLVVIDNT